MAPKYHRILTASHRGPNLGKKIAKFWPRASKRSHARHRKVRQTPGRRARPPFTRAGRAVVRVREVRLEVVKADREDRARHGRGWGASREKFGGNVV